MIGLILLGGNRRILRAPCLVVPLPLLPVDACGWGLVADNVVLAQPMGLAYWEVVSVDSYEQCVLRFHSSSR